MNTTNPENVPRDTLGTDAGQARDFPGIPPDIVHVGLHGINGMPALLPPHVYDEAVRQHPRFAELPFIVRHDLSREPERQRLSAAIRPLLINRPETESVTRRAMEMALQTGTAMVYKGRAIGLSEMLADPAPARFEVHQAPEPTRRLSAVAAAVAILTTPGAAA